MILKGRIHQEDIYTINIYAQNIGAPKYIRKILEDFKRNIDSKTLILEDFNAALSKMDRSSCWEPPCLISEAVNPQG